MDNVYMYTRVSTDLQSDNFSLPAQRQAIEQFANFKNYKIIREYCDNGFSGKNIQGRPQFQQMMDDITEGKDRIKFVLVFKLSRFARNAADTLESVQFLQDYGINLISVTDNIDSSVAAGKIMISILSSMAELERENILEQTMAGRRQKARDGKWNGGQAPLGYKLNNGKLEVVEEEARIVKDIFSIYLNTPLGTNYVAKEINLRYSKAKTRADSTEKYSRTMIQRILDNPIYTGQIAYGRRATTKIEGKRNEFHVIKQQDKNKIIIAEGDHEAIIDLETWEKVQAKRQEQGQKKEKLDPNHYYLLSSLLKCPECGGTMYGRPNGKKYKKNGEMYPISYSYCCRTSTNETGHHCSFTTQYGERKLVEEIKDIIIDLVNEKNFDNLVNLQLDSELDIDKIKEDIAKDNKEKRRLEAAQRRTEGLFLAIDYGADRTAEQQEESLQRRLTGILNQIADINERVNYAEQRIAQAQQKDATKEGIYQFLQHFEDIFDDLAQEDQRAIFAALIEKIELYPKTGRKGQWIKEITFAFPMEYHGQEIIGLTFSPKETQVESVVCLSRKKVGD